MLLRKLLLLFVLLATPFILFSKNPQIFKGQKPAWVTTPQAIAQQPNAREIKDGYYIKQFELQAHAEEKKTYFRIVREIVSETGIQNGSEISVSFDPSFERLTFHEVIIWRNNQPQNRLSLQDFKVIADEKELSKFIYQGSYNALLILSDIRKGDRIEFSYTVTGRNPIFGNKFSGFYYAQQYKPVSHLYTSIIASKGRNLKFKYFNNAPALKKSDHNGLFKYEWDLSNLKAIYYEEDEPMWFDIFPGVQVSDYSNWAEIVQWAMEVNPPSVVFKGELAQLVQQLKSKYADRPEVLFREAVKVVQDEVRYMGIEMGRYSHQANTPQKVFDQRFGDCKDKSLLLVSMLKSLGFNAYLALVSTREGNYIHKYLPSPFVFDHVVVKAIVQGKEVWVDATSAYQGGKGAAIYFPPYGKALVIQSGVNQLSQVPKSETGVSKVTERFTVKSQSSPALLEVESVYSLDKADNVRSFLAAESIENREKSYLEYYASSYPKIVKKDSLIINDDLDKNQLTVLEKYEIPDFFAKDSVTGTFHTGFYADYIGVRLPKISPNRKHPISVSYPFDFIYSCKVVLPNGWNIETKSNELKRKDFLFRSDYTASNDTLTLKYQFSYLADHVPVSRLKEFAADVKLLKDEYLSYDIVYTPDSIAFYPNYWLIAGCLALATILIYLAIRIYCKPTATSYKFGNPLPIGGWLIFVAILLITQVSAATYTLIVNKDFDLNNWNTYAMMEKQAFSQFLISMEVFTNLVVILFALFCLFLLFKRRDIFPKAMLYYLITASILTTILNLTNSLFYGENHWSSAIVIRSIISVIIWMQYIKNSERVRDTFILPYVVKEQMEGQEEGTIKEIEKERSL